MSELHHAVSSGNIPNYIRALMKPNINIDAQDDQGRTALHIACEKGSIRFAKYLMRLKKASMDVKDKKGRTPLQCTPKDKLVEMSVLFSQAEAKKLSREKKADGTRTLEKRYDEEEDEAEEAAVVSPSTMMKVVICIAIPLLFLLFVNGLWFAMKFIMITFGFYFISLAYFVSEVAVKPPWYAHGRREDGLIMKRCPDYWLEYISDPLTDFDLPFEDVEFKSTGGYTLRGWHVPGAGGARKVGVVLVHGGGRDRRAWLRHVPFLHAAGFGCLLFDLREHGLSDGKMRGFTFGLSERYDVVAATNTMRHRLHYGKICAMGTSVGGCSVLMAAAIEKGIDGVIAENAITTCSRLLKQQLTEQVGGYVSIRGQGIFSTFKQVCSFWLNVRVGNKPSKNCQSFHCIDLISPRPVLLMHGTNDSIVPHRHSEILFERAKEPKELFLVEGAFHCGLYNTKPEEYELRVLSFLRHLDELPTLEEKLKAE